ncbi:Intraflagellar transport protein 56 [Tritrichomonas musculus]|uniref:Intraflagellar transport protein 56 n=1 Tax=Tritrichomonas musculus TaxID=1915356 RepID=A0ABR2KLB1_9EUKA
MIVGSIKKKQQPPPKKIEEFTPPPQESNEALILRFIESRDFSGASTFIDFLFDELGQTKTTDFLLWKAYALFHLGRYSDAIEVYENIMKAEPNDVINLFISSCYYYVSDFENAKLYADKGPTSDFRTRLQFHIAHKLNDEQELFQAHSQLVGTLENQLSLAAIHYMRTHYQDAIDIYQRLLIQHPEYIALHVYIAMCQYKLDKFEESNESVDQYLGINSDSAVALNLKSCDYLRLFDPEVAESQLLQIRKFSSSSYDFVESLVKHNLCIFHDGTDGFTILTPLASVLHEARYNLCILYMRENNPTEAFNLISEQFQPLDISEHLLKATVYLAMGQITADTGQIEEANSIFNEIGEMEVVKDTVPGRQALATSKFVVGEYEEVLRIFKTIETVLVDNDEFNYNKGMALAALSRWAEAERYFLLVKNATYTREIFYNSWLCRCYIKNKKPEAAWNLYSEATSTEDAKTLLEIISNDCFLSGDYYYSMRAYQILSQFELEPTYKEGMIASAAGVFRNILSRRDTPDKLQEVVAVLSEEPDAQQVLQIIVNYVETSGQFTDAY